MTKLAPIYTEKSECQDCYKCLRQCAVKAIKVQGGCATVMPEYCICCGHCVEVCPSGAKRVRNDINAARRLLLEAPRVIVSLAPSFVSEFTPIRPEQMIGALRKLGFYGVSETALGAQQVSLHVRLEMDKGERKLLLSSACPTVVDYVRKYHPGQAEKVTNLHSPVLAHCKMLRREYDEEIGIVFIGPCIAKKGEADYHPDLLDVALTFEELRQWFEQEGIRPEEIVATSADHFIPEEAHEGALYPIEGGMSAAVRANSPTDAGFMSFSGLTSIRRALTEMRDWQPEKGIFVELLACNGGCINGPKAHLKSGTVCKRYEVIKSAKPRAPGEEKLVVSIEEPRSGGTPQRPQFSEAQIRDALRMVGKRSAVDEKNCGGCGYDRCREFARALLENKAERTMCATYMRQLAQKKANALMMKMPSAAVMVNEQMRIIECNHKFRSMFADELAAARAAEIADDVLLSEIVPFHGLFQRVLESGEDIRDRDFRFRGSILHCSIFVIEPNAVIGAILQDITESTMQKEQIIARAQQVIQKNLTTVQQIAYLLGENAAESETTLNSIVESFSVKESEDDVKR
jgi:iron only hydrogenase large subunit-like protein